MAAAPEFLRFVLAFAVIVVPGILAAGALFPRRPPGDRLAIGCVVGLASAVYLAIAVAYARLWLFYPAWAIATAAAFHAWWRAGRPPLSVRPSRRDWAIIAILAVIAISRFALALRHELPLGWDPSFHLLLAKKILATGRMIFDWRPFEDIALNYPVGSHALVAILSQATGIPLHAAFRLLIPTLGVLSAALVHAFARSVSGDDDVAVFSLTAYGLWAVYGSIDYYRWGGLPNLLGMTFTMAALLLLFNRAAGRRETAVFALFFTATFLTHHHVMLTSGLVFAALAAFFLFRQGEKPRARVILAGLLASLLLGCFYIVPYAWKAWTLGSTGTLAFDEMFYDVRTIAASMGTAFFITSLAGVVLHRFARARSAQLGVLYVVMTTVLALFVFFEYGWRAMALRAYGYGYVAFTPSRFLTDSVYFSAVFAGYALVSARRALRLPLVPALALCVAVATTNRTAWAKASIVPPSEGRMKIYRWIERYTPPDTLVITDDAWAAYGTWRRCSVTPIPISEPATADTPKARLFDAILRGEIPSEASAAKIVQVARPGTAIRPGRILWRASTGLAVVDVTPNRPW